MSKNRSAEETKKDSQVLELQEQLKDALESIEELQTKVAFQEYTIDSLNDALSSQQKQMDDISFKLRHVVDRVKSIEPSNMAKESEETQPPHF